MVRSYKTRNVALPLDLYEELQKTKERLRRYSSFHSFICEILDKYVQEHAGESVVRTIRAPHKTEASGERKVG